MTGTEAQTAQRNASRVLVAEQNVVNIARRLSRIQDDDPRYALLLDSLNAAKRDLDQARTWCQSKGVAKP